MKLKLFLALSAVLMLTGCAGGERLDAVPSAENPGQEQSADSSAQEQSAEDSSQTQTTQTAEINAEGTGAQEEEAYVLTFEASTIEGDVLTSECFGDSKLTMLNVWATYCNPCLSEMPDLGEIAASYETADFQLIGIVSDVTEDSGEEEVENARDLIEQTGADYPHLLLNQSLYQNLVGAVDVVPTTFFVNQKGEVLGYVTSALSKEAWEEIIEGLLQDIEETE